MRADTIPPPNAQLIRAAMARDRLARIFAVAFVVLLVGALVSNRYIANRDVFALCASLGFLSLLGFALATNAAAGRMLGSPACRKCGYDRRGINTSDPCPECGSDAGTMRADIGPTAIRRHKGYVLCVCFGIPIACFTSFWPLTIPWLPAAMHLQDLEELLILLLFMTWVIPAGAATVGIRNLVRWRQFQTDLHHELSLAARTANAPTTPHPRQLPDAPPDA